ncbi:hypothetical protein M501DRAFT_914608, partial [Patellaria atrata CBS 101060]
TPNILSQLESRSGPNQRLVAAFGINNSFTTVNNDYNKQFRSFTERLIKITDEEWYIIAGDASKVLLGKLPENDIKLPLVPIVQNLTLKLSLAVLFDVNPHSVNDISVSIVAKEINRIWLASKEPETLENWVAQGDIHQALRNILPNLNPLLDRQNPMNLILPAYETLWRVVLRCFIEVVSRDSPNKEIWRSILRNFLREPTRANLLRKEDNVSAQWIAMEALRLYPPTRRVYRHFLHRPYHAEYINVDNYELTMLAADIESSQRNEQAWGEDRTKFVPERWSELREGVLRRIFMAFGTKPFVCPAKPYFGPHIIAIIVASLSE